MSQRKHALTGGNGESRAGEAARQPVIGVVEWFRPGEYEHVEQVLADLKSMKVEELRTGLSWADYHTTEGEEWYGWLLPRLAREVCVLPCLLYTPPSLALSARATAPPRNVREYADFLDVMITRFDRHFEYLELWNAANSPRGWDLTVDPEWTMFSEMIGAAAHWARRRGKKTVLAGMEPVDAHWLERMFRTGVMEHIDVVGLHGFPNVWDAPWDGWAQAMERVRDVLEAHGSPARIWITAAGYSTWRRNELGQLEAFLEAMSSGAERVYWHSARDLDPLLPTATGLHADEREYHFGLRFRDGRPKLLARRWIEGGLASLPAARESLRARPLHLHGEKHVLVTGGAGFIGSNVADRLLRMGKRVLVLDNLSRPGVEKNLQWLQERYPDRLQVQVSDIRDTLSLKRAVQRAEQVFHFTAQVAVTTSLVDPIDDFEINAGGTVGLLNALRSLNDPPPVVFTSTNKVYGAIDDIPLRMGETRYEPIDDEIRLRGISESRGLDFHSPYGCSKGTADQYIVDFARTEGVPGIVFRMSCIYGPRQFGTEDQGWVAHFLIKAMDGEPVIVYGDGRQVRDILFVDDLVNAMLLAQANMSRLAGQAFNMGGGPERTTSLLELLALIRELHGREPAARFGEWRTADQRYYVSDTGKFRAATGWSPRVGVREGVEKLYEWLRDMRGERRATSRQRKVRAATS